MPGKGFGKKSKSMGLKAFFDYCQLPAARVAAGAGAFRSSSSGDGGSSGRISIRSTNNRHTRARLISRRARVGVCVCFLFNVAEGVLAETRNFMQTCTFLTSCFASVCLQFLLIPWWL